MKLLFPSLFTPSPNLPIQINPPHPPQPHRFTNPNQSLLNISSSTSLFSFEQLTTMAGTTKIAVVTGANKGIGFEICRQLGSRGDITVVLGARDHKRGLEAVEKLKGLGVGDHIVFHQLDVTDSASVAALAQFIKSKFGKLDILVNNAGVSGANIDGEALRAATKAEDVSKVDWKNIVVETNETVDSAFQINFYGVKRTTEALLPLLKLSDSPRVVNVGSIMGTLENVPHEWAKGILSDIENLTEEKLDEVVNEFVKDFKEGTLKEKGWPMHNSSSYIVSKAVVMAYTRLVAKQHPSVKINAVCPGFTKTDINHFSGYLTVEEGAGYPVRVALLPDDGPSGAFFNQKEVAEF